MKVRMMAMMREKKVGTASKAAFYCSSLSHNSPLHACHICSKALTFGRLTINVCRGGTLLCHQSVTGKISGAVGRHCGNRRRSRRRGHRLRRTRLSRIAGAIPLNRYKRDPIKQPLGYFEHWALMAQYNAIVALDIKTNRRHLARARFARFMRNLHIFTALASCLQRVIFLTEFAQRFESNKADPIINYSFLIYDKQPTILV
jgi:hypothetical protein